MAGVFTTLAILDGAGNSKNMRVWDESGGGTGPFVFSSDYAGSDSSSTIAAGGVAQNAFSGAPLHGFLLCNPDPSEVLWFSISTTAAANATGSLSLAPMGGTFISPPGMIPFANVSVIAATTGHKYTAVQW